MAGSRCSLVCYSPVPRCSCARVKGGSGTHEGYSRLSAVQRAGGPRPARNDVNVGNAQALSKPRQPALEGLIVPSKFYGVAAAGQPVLYVGDPGGEIGSIIRSADCGFCVGVGEAGPAAEFLRALIGDPVRAEQLGCNARRIFDERYDKRFALASWHRVIGVDERIADREAAAQHLRGST